MDKLSTRRQLDLISKKTFLRNPEISSIRRRLEGKVMGYDFRMERKLLVEFTV